jgi:hypothetical protein
MPPTKTPAGPRRPLAATAVRPSAAVARLLTGKAGRVAVAGFNSAI